jgi:MalT-like TPR region
MGAPEARICYERAEPLCLSLNHPRLLYMALSGQFRYTLVTDKLSAALRIVQRLYSLAQEQNDAGLMLGAYGALSSTFYFLGEFETARQYARHGVRLWRSGIQYPAEEYIAPIASCLNFGALCEWHLGEIAACHAMTYEGILVARELKDTDALAQALACAAGVAYFERDPAEVERFASKMIELSTRHHLLHWLALGTIHRGWALCASGNPSEGIPGIEQGIRDFQKMGPVLGLISHERLKLCISRIVPLKLLRQLTRRKRWLKDLKTAFGLPNCSGCAVYFSRLWALMRPKSRLRSARLSG